MQQLIYRDLDCGYPHNGFARVKCKVCGHEVQAGKNRGADCPHGSQTEEDKAILCEPDICRDPERIKHLNQEMKAVSAKLEDLYDLRLEAIEESLRSGAV